jgi:GDP-4-dehydro-6-deoxy-D-mannose reductase
LQRILISGGTGFVGTHLIRFLKSRPSKIIVFSSGDGSSLREPGVDYYKVDIRSGDEVRSVVREASPDQVYHLAGISAVDVSWKNPRLTFEVNVVGAFNLFEGAMSLPSPPKILNVSTSQVYARSSGPLTEASPLGPENPYAASKAMTEFLLVQYRNCVKGGIITARSFNHTGPGQLPNFVLSSVAKQFAEIEAALRPPTLKVGDLGVKRDFTDVRDVVRAYCELLDKGKIGEVYNVCSGCPVLLADAVKEFQANCRTPVTTEIDQARLRSGEVAQMVGDSTKIRTEIGWSPSISLRMTIRDLLDYWRGRTRQPLTKAFS